MREILLRLFGAAADSAQYGVRPEIEHSWPLPTWVAMLAMLLAGAAAAAVYLREQPTPTAFTDYLRGRGRWWLLPWLAAIAGIFGWFAWVLSGSLAAAVAIGCILAAAAGAAHAWLPLERLLQGELAGLRIALFGLLLLMMYGFLARPYQTDLPELVIAVDDSASMSVADRYADRQQRERIQQLLSAGGQSAATRWALVQALLTAAERKDLARLAGRYRVKLVRIGETARYAALGKAPLPAALSGKADGTSSALGQSLRTILQKQRGRPTAAVILFTDGITSEGPSLVDAAQYARRRNIPLYTVAIGNAEPARDIRLVDMVVDPVVFVGDRVTVEVQIAASSLAGRSARLRLRAAGSPSPLAEEEIQLGNQPRQTARLTFVPTEAAESLELIAEVAPAPGELNPRNNLQRQTISVRDETIRVLLVQAYPSYEFRFLKNLLERAMAPREGGKPAVKLTTVLQEADPEFAQLDKTAVRVFPVQRDVLFENYDVILFGDVDPAFLSQQAMRNIADFVSERGGGVAFLAGPRFTPTAYQGTPLEPLFPVDLDEVEAPPADAPLTTSAPLRPSRLGLATPHLQLGESPAESREIWQRLPGVYWSLAATKLKPGARVLAEHATETGPDGRRLPLILMQFVGNGKVLFHATDETWRWRFRVGDLFASRYWLQTIRYLSRTKLLGQESIVELSTDRQTYRRGEPVRLRARFLDEREAPAADDGVTVVLRRVGDTRRQVRLTRGGAAQGLFEGVVSDLSVGEYEAWMVEPAVEGKPPTTRFSVEAPPGEMARLETDVEELRTAAEQSLGRYYDAATVDRLWSELPPGEAVPISALPPRPLWNIWPLAAVFAALLIGEWLLRKGIGLL